jgi:enterochelin esterase-like enzyme
MLGRHAYFCRPAFMSFPVFFALSLIAPVGLGWLRIFAPREARVVDYPRWRSKIMAKNFRIEVWMPPGRTKGKCNDCQVLISNDGQDLRAMHVRQTLDSMIVRREIAPVIVVGIHAGSRLQDYGVSGHPDYLRRGGLAEKYARFITKELLPFIYKEYKTKEGPENTAIMGFSLGGLSAFDIAYNHSSQISRAGIFSGSFWWRSRGYADGYTDDDRIMQAMVRANPKIPKARFWFEVGGEDETNDRDGDGIIDAIGDTRDLIEELKSKGFKQPDDIEYYEMEDGRHNQETWGKALPRFLAWAFPFTISASRP